MNNRILALGLVLGLLVCWPATGSAKNIFKDLIKVYQTYENVNMMMWLAGDAKAERRFGEEVKWFINLTNKKEKDPEVNRWVHTVFNRVKPLFRDRGFDYNLTILKGNSVNAFAIPGGSVFIYRGMLNFVSSDDELAAVLAHELAHAERRHSLKQLRTSTAFQLLLQKAVKNRRDRDSWGQLVGALTLLKFSRQDEDEADDIGQRKMFQAGFNPAGQVTLWEKFVQKFGKGENGVLQYLSTHPPSQDRVDNARKNLGNMKVPVTKDFNLSFNVLADVEENLLQNSSFETDLQKRQFPDAWEIKEGKAAIDPNHAVTGKLSLCLNADTGFRPVRVFSELIPINPKEKYVLRGWVKSANGQQKASVGAELYDRNKRLRGFIWPILSGSSVYPDWTKFEGTYETGATAAVNLAPDTAFMRVVLQNGPMSRGEIWFDDLNLRRGSFKPQPNLLVNGSFELEGENGVPQGVKGTTGAIWRDTKYFRVGYAALKMGPLGGAGETEMTFAPLTLADVKDGQSLQLSGQYSADFSGKGKMAVTLIDVNGQPMANKTLFEREFTIKPEIWQNTGGTFAVRLTPEEKAVARLINIRISAQIPATGSLWLDGFIVR